MFFNCYNKPTYNNKKLEIGVTIRNFSIMWTYLILLISKMLPDKGYMFILLFGYLVIIYLSYIIIKEKEFRGINFSNKKKNFSDYLKKINLNKIKNEYKLKLVKYQNEKEKEKERKLAQMEIKKREFEAKKECEINDMKNKALFVQELIAIFKTNILNS
jgi:hypothetical protein